MVLCEDQQHPSRLFALDVVRFFAEHVGRVFSPLFTTKAGLVSTSSEPTTSICLMVGGDAARFVKLANMSNMPADRQPTCQGDFSNTSRSWEKSLTPHMRRPDQPKTKFNVRYVDNDKYQAQAAVSLRL